MHEGDHVKAIITEINTETKKISLGLKASLFPEGEGDDSDDESGSDDGDDSDAEMMDDGEGDDDSEDEQEGSDDEQADLNAASDSDVEFDDVEEPQIEVSRPLHSCYRRQLLTGLGARRSR